MENLNQWLTILLAKEKLLNELQRGKISYFKM